MLLAEPLCRVQLLVLASEAQDAALDLARFGAFNPAPGGVAELAEAPATAYREVWLEARARLDKLLRRCGIADAPAIPADAEAPALDDLRELNEWLRSAWTGCLEQQEIETHIAAARTRIDELEDTLTRLERLKVELAPLLRADSLLAFDIGSLPARAYKRLADALAITGHLAARFDESGERVYAVIAGPRARHAEVRALLAQAGWHELAVPDELRARPREARAWLTGERARLERAAAEAGRRAQALHARFAPRLAEARLNLALARPLAEAALAGVAGRGALALLSGWVPRRQLPALQNLLDTRFHGRVWLDARAPRPGEAAPSFLCYPRWLAPFAGLVGQYGVPRYGEVDPALPFAFTWLLLFGAMFGDVGHGAAIFALAALFRRRLGGLAGPGMAAGLASMGFGVLYGSVFGYEDLLAPLWLSPMHDPLRALTLAVGFGVGFIVFTLLVNARNHWAAGRRGAALFDGGGLAGLAFYLGAAGVLGDLAGVVNLPHTGWFAVAGLLTVAAHKVREPGGVLGERLLVAVVETLETVIGLFSNTLSFMRVAAFTLNHVALALAVFALAGGLDAVGHGVALALGNVVIVVLEGGIVAIQALRLLYYEGFSRFFSGDGKVFVPLRLA